MVVLRKDSDVLKRILNKPGVQKAESHDAESPQTEGTEDILFAPLEPLASKNQIPANVFPDAPPPGSFEITGDTAQAFDAFLNNDRFFEEMNLVASNKLMGNVGAYKQNDPPNVSNLSSGFSANSLYNLISNHPGPIIESGYLHNVPTQPGMANSGTQTKGRTSGGSLTTLESVIEEVLSTMKFHAIRDRLEIPRSTLSLSPEEIEIFDSYTRTGVTSLAVRAFLKSTHLGGYTRVMGFAGLVESIMQWRMAPTSENRAKIPHPFTPTVLQQRFTDHHPAIDFMTWGDLRDQLLLYVNLDSVDLNKLLYDSVRCVVREFQQLQLAVPVLDTVAYIAITHGAVSTKATTATNETYGPNYELKDESHMQAVVDRIHKYGFDKLEERKISPTFGVAYPFLDISNTVTKMPVVDYRSIQSCF
ncbi:uncharacterized protein BDZ99DRAFT_513099 [Mytilinidion resinicola]|uniref:Uncharacterized protein n=1 Tax=Mytilinidion resinicola TaxID=574789 RepID=A0A6A6Z967_9PEZI|nr:uncharacterized protein BDZ99DRAFT_513099 [Mytilinidion resinicola]KAF2816825.1 hypothetical protein BDZ99DRAFT_513099 [Mytilinidion resinicola]